MTVNFKRRKAASWTQNNDLLGPGEPGYERDTGKMKIGDGLTRWNDLPYFGEGTPPEGGDEGPVLPEGTTVWKGLYNPETEYKVGDIVKSAGVPWICTADNVGELPALPLSGVEPQTALATTAIGSNIKPYADPYLPFVDQQQNWDHEYRYFDILPGGTIIIELTVANVGNVRLLKASDGTEIYNSQTEGVPVVGPHIIHNLQPGRYVVDKNAVNSNKAQGVDGHVPAAQISADNDAVIWGVDISDAPIPSWEPMMDPT